MTEVREKFSDDSTEGRKFKTDIFEIRFKQLNDMLFGQTGDAMQYLWAINGGGALAMLGLVGSLERWRVQTWPYALLAVFVLGLMLAGVARLSLLLYLKGLVDGWGNDAMRHATGTLRWSEFLANDADRVERFGFWPWLLSLLAFICFIGASIATAYFFANSAFLDATSVSLKLSSAVR